MFEYYFSLNGAEKYIEDVIKISVNGYKIKAIKVSYLYMDEKVEHLLKEYKDKVGGKVIIDSDGKYINNTLKSPIGDKMLKKIGSVDKYFEDYLNWLINHKDLYDYAIEFNVESDKRAEWRKKMADNGIPFIAVVEDKITDDLYTNYVAVADVTPNDARRLNGIISKGYLVHVIGYGGNNLSEMAKYCMSMDSGLWLVGKKFGQILVKGENLSFKTYKIKEEPILYSNILKDKFVLDNFGDSIEKNRRNKMLSSFWNMWTLQQIVDAFNVKTKGVYEEIAEKYKKGELALPQTAIETYKTDQRAKIEVLKNRFNNYKNGQYAKMLFDYAITCGQCPYRDKCPMAGKDDDICYFLPYFKKKSLETRNKNEVIKRVEEIVAEKMQDWLMAKYGQKLTGNVIDRTVLLAESELLKALDLLAKLKYGDTAQFQMNVLNLGNTHVIASSLDAELEKIRKEFGEALADKIRKKIEGDRDEQ